MPRTRLLLAILAAFDTLSVEAQAATPAESPLSWHGITLYGVVDIGVAYQSHGATASDYFAQGVDYGVSRNSANAVTGLAPNGLSQTRLGVKGEHALSDELSGLFTLETRFSPLSGEIANGPRSLLQNNGTALGAQSANGDSSQAGQLFSAAAWAGVRSARFGTLTLGRQNGLLYDNVLAYDPLGGSYAFSLIGFSAVAAGGGFSEYNRLNNSARYLGNIGTLHLGIQYQAAGQEVGGQGSQVNIGATHGGLSADLTYSNKHNAISLASYSPTSTQLAQLQAAGLTLGSVLAATIADTRSLSLMVRYPLAGWKFYGGYEAIVYSSPDLGSPYLNVGASTIGGYTLGAVSSNAFNTAKTLGVTWMGARHALASDLDLIGAAYHYRQNSYASGKLAGCNDAAAATCSGAETALSLVLDYRYDALLDFYGGAFRSEVSGGLAAGFLNSSVLSLMTGLRLVF